MTQKNNSCLSKGNSHLKSYTYTGIHWEASLQRALVEEASVNALILQGSATNVDDWISHVTPWYTKPFLTIQVDPAFHSVDNRATLSQHYAGPLLIIAGENDKQAPPALSEHLFDASQSQQKKLIIVKDADHSGMFKNDTTVESYQAFLDAI